MDFNVWKMLKELKEKHLNRIKGEYVDLKRYSVTLVDERTQKIIRLVDYREPLKEIVSTAEQKDQMIRINIISEDES